MPFSKFPIVINAIMSPMVFSVRGICLRTSGLWNFAADIDEKDNPFKNKKGILVWRCTMCIQNNIHLEYILRGGNNYFKDCL